MGNKRLKVFFNKLPEGGSNLKNYFPFFVFFKNFKYKIVNDYRNADIIFELTCHGGRSLLNEKNKIVIIVSGENIRIRRNFFNWIERGMGIFFKKGIKHKIMDLFDLVIPLPVQKIPISYFFPEYLKYIREINKNKNHYAILCNKEFEGEKIYSYPLFLADFHDRMNLLIKKEKTRSLKGKKFCAFAVSSNSDRERVRFYKLLSKYKKIDSHGLVLNNQGSSVQRHWGDNPRLFSKYKFVICFENSYADDFITEKLTNAMLSGAIPIFRGPKNTKNYFDTRSFINYEDYGSYSKMIKEIVHLDKDDERYLNLLEKPWYHRNVLPKEFKEKEKELVKFYEKIINGRK